MNHFYHKYILLLLLCYSISFIDNYKLFSSRSPRYSGNKQLTSKISSQSNDIHFIESITYQKVCRICKQEYNPLNNTFNSCIFHKGRYLGAENSKHYGTKSGGKNLGISFFWDCCDEESYDGGGCCRSKHKSYNE